MTPQATSGRQAILDRLRSRLLDPTALPPLDGPWLMFDDPVEQFAKTVEFVGGTCVRHLDFQSIVTRLHDVTRELDSKRVCSLLAARATHASDAHKKDVRTRLAASVQSNVDLDTIDDPHRLADVDWVIDWAHFGVAENGAVWLDDVGVRHRAVHFITQHLVLVVSASDIVNNMHEAYQKLSIQGPRFGVFLSGPSKTADIEQSLVLGAHGSRTLEVLIFTS